MNREKNKGIVLIQKVDEYFALNGEPVDYNEVTEKVETVIILPEKKEII